MVLESTFLGIWIFGWGKLSKGLHLTCIWLVAGAAMLSAAFIMAANSWMGRPFSARIPARSEGRPHGEIRLLGPVGVFRADRASATRPATCVPYSPPLERLLGGRRRQRRRSPGPRTRRPDRSSSTSGPSRIGMGSGCRRFGQGDRFAKPERAAVRMPKPVTGMDQKSDRRGMDRLGAPRPLLERPERRAAKGEQRFRAEFARQSLDHPPAPAVERIVQTVACLGRCGECAPALAPSNAGEHDRPNVRQLVNTVAISESARAARNEAGPLDGEKDGLD